MSAHSPQAIVRDCEIFHHVAHLAWSSTFDEVSHTCISLAWHEASLNTRCALVTAPIADRSDSLSSLEWSLGASSGDGSRQGPGTPCRHFAKGFRLIRW